ncbi:hypothetical protein FACS189490_12150 [Clostridia bacterium]|nr:hypothetical protein FACS189490_12150 [Clostridia bacterium]
MSVIVARNLNGISINGELEYLLDDTGNEIVFENQPAAEEFLLRNGFDEDDLEFFHFILFEQDKEV